jgi:hypothetical protein
MTARRRRIRHGAAKDALEGAWCITIHDRARERNLEGETPSTVSASIRPLTN